ncbi:MAG: dTMP kinase [Thermoguttaceae bacterium]|jgi:dTMP kinase
MFIAIDGGDGSGKGVQIGLLKEWFISRGVDPLFIHDPGDTVLGEKLRSLLLKGRDYEVCPLAEAALFMASRAQLIDEKIRPALESGRVVFTDRYLLSTIVYQGYASGATREEIETLWNVGINLTQNVLPDLTFVLDCPAEECSRRLVGERDRIESKGTDFHKRVVDGYRQAVESWKKKSLGEAFIIDADRSPGEVFAEIRTILEQHF